MDHFKVPYQWYTLKEVEIDNITSLQVRQDITKTIDHGYWKVSSGGSVVDKGFCIFNCANTNCSRKIKLKWDIHSPTKVQVLNKGTCGHEQHVSPNTLSHEICKMIKGLYDSNQTCQQIYEFIVGQNIIEIGKDTKELIYKQVRSYYRKDIRTLQNEYLGNITDVLCRKTLFRKYVIQNSSDFLKDTTKPLFMISSESDYYNNPTKNANELQYDALTFTSHKLVNVNLKSALMQREVYLSLDGTFKYLGKSRGSWQIISLGTYSTMTKKSTETTKAYRPFLFMLCDGETKEATMTLFHVFEKIAKWIGFTRNKDYSVACVVSDAAPGFQYGAREYFSEDVVMSCFVHLKRRIKHDWKIKDGHQDLMYKILDTLHICVTKEQLSRVLDIVLEYIKYVLKAEETTDKKNDAMIQEYCKHISNLCDPKSMYRARFSYPFTKVGFPLETNRVENFNKQLNRKRTGGALFCHESKGGLRNIIRVSEGEGFLGEVHYVSPDCCRNDFIKKAKNYSRMFISMSKSRILFRKKNQQNVQFTQKILTMYGHIL